MESGCRMEVRLTMAFPELFDEIEPLLMLQWSGKRPQKNLQKIVCLDFQVCVSCGEEGVMGFSAKAEFMLSPNPLSNSFWGHKLAGLDQAPSQPPGSCWSVGL